METSDKEIARRVLSDVLERLNGEARAESVSKMSVAREANSFEQARLHNGRHSSAAENAAPIIFIVVNQSPSSSDLLLNAPIASAAETTRATILNGSGREMHPGLEKFPVEEDHAATTAPKTCFMEPGRACVNSGACEMRGY